MCRDMGTWKWARGQALWLWMQMKYSNGAGPCRRKRDHDQANSVAR